jgi:Protein of unknown function (DUF3040)
MGLHPRERRKLRQIEERLRKDYPGLDTLLRGGGGRLESRARVAGALAGYLVSPALLVAGLVSGVTWLVVTGAVLCLLTPVIAWLTISRHFTN